MFSSETEWQEQGAREAASRLAKSVLKIKKHQRATFFSPSENRCLPASTLKPEEREFVVDSGASMHMISKKDLSDAEMDTLTTSCSPTIVITANGEVQTHEEAIVYVKELDLFLTMKVLDNTSAVLSLGKLCDANGYSYEWINGQKPHLIKNGIRIICNTENFVPIVVPGLSSSSSGSSSTSRTPMKQESHSSSSSSSSPSSPTVGEISVREREDAPDSDISPVPVSNLVAVAMLKKGYWQERESVTDECHDRPGKPDKRSDKKLGQNSSKRRFSDTRQLGCVFQDMTPPKSILRKGTDMPKPIQRVKFTKAIARHTKIRDQNPSLGYICPGEPNERSPNARKFEDRSLEETEWQEQGAREAAWKLAKSVLKLKEKNRATFFSPSEHRYLPASTLKHGERETPERRCI